MVQLCSLYSIKLSMKKIMRYDYEFNHASALLDAGRHEKQLIVSVYFQRLIITDFYYVPSMLLLLCWRVLNFIFVYCSPPQPE